MADAAWKKLKDKVTAKRGKKPDAGDTTHKLLKGKELTVQRLSSEVSGKAQKYARIGPREFVAFTEDELTIENIKRCFEGHFATQVTSLVWSCRRAGFFLQDFGADTGYEGDLREIRYW